MDEKIERLMAEIVVVNNERLLHELALKLGKLSESERRNHFGGREAFGFVYLFRDPAVNADVVYECVVSPAGDAITSLYVNHSVNATLGEWLRTREYLIERLARKIGLSVQSIGIEDPGRGRAMGLAELSTGQLLDLLAERMGKSIVVTDSHGVEVPRVH